MPRAKPFTRENVKARQAQYDAFTLDPNVIEKIKAILKFERVTAANVQRLVSAIEQAFRTYSVTVLADSQESPARIVAALKPGLATAERLRDWLKTLPKSVRFDLKTPGLEGLFDRVKKLSADWQAKVHAGPVHGPAALSLRQLLSSILANDICDKQKRDRAVADILRAKGIKFPDEKKNRGRFTGTKRPK